jgi:23S rRNA (pseudouridine1915-N3)-methyltransferase
MKIRVLWVGKTKERYVREGVEKYLKLLKPFAEVRTVEIKEQKGEEVKKEGQRILKQSGSYILLDERGKELTSEELAFLLTGQSEMDFVLGGPYGVSAEVKENASETVALSRMTLTHEMSRLILLEQIYRAMMIKRGGGYHH